MEFNFKFLDFKNTKVILRVLVILEILDFESIQVTFRLF